MAQGVVKDLTREQRKILKWLYDSAENWRGGLAPDEWPEYDMWLKEAKILISKLKVVE